MSTPNRKTRLFALVGVLLLTVMGTPPARAQTFEEAVTAYERGDHATALRGLRIHAARGNARAQYKLGLMYSRGKGVSRDPAEAARWFRRVAEQGHANAQFSLGVGYGIGYGVPQDYTEALRWFRRAAEQGHANAQFSLGAMYFIGYGVPEDYAEAVRWYRQAAEQGHANAQSGLGFMYEIGGGVPHNLVQAHKWHNLAASRASSSEREVREKAVRSRDRVASRLTPAELAKAQRRAGAWRSREPAVEQLEEEEHPCRVAGDTLRSR